MSPTRLAVCVLVLSFAGTLSATVPSVRKFVGELSVGDWEFFLKDGRPVLIRRRFAKDEPTATLLGPWNVSSPTMTARDGLRLTADVAADTPQLAMTKEKARGADWTFEIVEQIKPIPYGTVRGQRGRPYREGPEGYTFRARVGEGKYQGWYLAAPPLPADEQKAAESKPVMRPLTLVQRQADATVFRYIAAEHVEDRGRR